MSATGRRALRRAGATLLVLIALAVGTRTATARENELDSLAGRLEHASIVLARTDGSQVTLRRGDSGQAETISEASIVELLAVSQLSQNQAGRFWRLLADSSNADLVTLPIVRALAGAASTPEAREIMWLGLIDLAKTGSGRRSPPPSLLALFENHRDALLPVIGDGRATEAAGNAMVDLMTSSRLFGDDVEAGVRWIGYRHPEALARRIQSERDRGRPVEWEEQGVSQMVLWTGRHLKPGAPDAPRSLDALDAAGARFAVMFNSLYPLDDSYRQQLLRGLGPVEAFDIVIGGETELYRMGTSSFRKFLHPLIMRGIGESRSFETFIATTALARLGDGPAEVVNRRGMVYLRVASAFGLLEQVIATVHERDTFIGKAIDSLGDAAHFENNAAVLLDLLTERTSAPAVETFRRELLDRLYGRYENETDGPRRSIYASLLSVYQSVTGDHRDPSIDRAFPLDSSTQRKPFDALFSPDPNGGHVHRMLMRFDEDVDASSNYKSFRKLMRSHRARVHSGRNFEIYSLENGRISVEIYVNRPTPAGVRDGIEELRKVLDGATVHTVIGRGHSGIIEPLIKASTRILGSRTNRVAGVIVGTCGGTSSLKGFIDTFGYTQVVSTRSTGRQILNDAIIDRYFRALLNLTPDGHIALADVLANALDPYRRPGNSSGIRDDAGFYHVNSVGVFAAMLFDRHIRGTVATEVAAPSVASEDLPTRPARSDGRRLDPAPFSNQP